VKVRVMGDGAVYAQSHRNYASRSAKAAKTARSIHLQRCPESPIGYSSAAVSCPSHGTHAAVGRGIDRMNAVPHASASSLGSRLPSLTSLRFLAALAVVGFHACVAAPIIPPGALEDVLGFVFAGGAAGVSFFFVLSGFVLAWTASPGRAAQFRRRRAAKIMPNHLITWLIVLAAGVLLHDRISAVTALACAGLVQAWVPDPNVYFGVNTPSWSLSCEAFFYMLFPLLFVVLSRCRTSNLRAGAAVLAVLPATFAALSIRLPHSTAYWLIYIFPPIRAIEFVLGICVALLVRRGALPRIAFPLAAVLAATALLAGGHLSWRWGFASLAAPAAAMLICAAAQSDVGETTPQWLHSPIMIRLGEASFALYLVHQIVLRFVPGARGSVAIGVILLFLSIGFAVAWALAQYRLIEQPLYRIFSRGGRPSHRSANLGGVPSSDGS
jgi:peptidoglycan/LPS O-acetylase OafA/YrhL